MSAKIGTPNQPGNLIATGRRRRDSEEAKKPLIHHQYPTAVRVCGEAQVRQHCLSADLCLIHR
jgi:hypothetical protein